MSVKFPELQSGRVVRVTRYSHLGAIFEGDWWGVVASPEQDDIWAEIALLGEDPPWGSSRELLLASQDHWEIVPLDDLPDEVLAALAVWRLTGE